MALGKPTQRVKTVTLPTHKLTFAGPYPGFSKGGFKNVLCLLLIGSTALVL